MKKLKSGVAGIILLLLIAIINIVQTIFTDNQAVPASVLDLSFHGEYKTGESDWKPIVAWEHISADDGEVILRGTFMMSFPDGEIVGPLEKGEAVALFFDHLGGSVWINGTENNVFDAENPEIGNFTCGKYWLVYHNDVGEEDTLEIHLRNPHAFGNKLAVDKFLDSMRIYTGDDFEILLEKQTENMRAIGSIIIFVSVFILGIAMFSSLLRMSKSEVVWLVGAVILFAGCYFVVHSTDTYTLNTNVTLNTAVYLLSTFIYVALLQMLIVQFFERPLKKAGSRIATASVVTTSLLILFATVFNRKLYDMLPAWAICQVIVSVILLGFSCKNMRYMKDWMKIVQMLLGAVLFCFVLDIVATWRGWWQGAYSSSFIFLIMFMTALFVVLRVFPDSIRATLREKEMQAELEKTKTAVMFSQIQPHFLYNALSAIRELCRRDPEDARNALSTFITYLRGNMESIQREHSIHFSKELNHISAYLQLEKLRFGEDLQVVIDIQENDFYVPSLTIQPLVENAVKHGVCSREDGGTVTIHTHREGNMVIVKIQDDGVGFDPDTLEKLEHVGIQNVRTRLGCMVNGTLEFESQIGVGTTATITIYDRKD